MAFFTGLLVTVDKHHTMHAGEIETRESVDFPYAVTAVSVRTAVNHVDVE